MEDFLDKLPKFYDEYDRRARILPGLIALSPIIVSIWAWFPENSAWNVLITIFISCGGPALLSKTVREQGKKKESYLYRSENGKMPTTTMLRHRDSTIDPVTKQRYHDILQKKLKNVTFPGADIELSDPEKADYFYDSAIRWLKEQTRNKKEFPLVMEELINFGFARNVWGMKSVGLFIALILMALNGIGIYYQFLVSTLATSNGNANLLQYIANLTSISPIRWIAIVFCFILIIWWIFFVTKSSTLSSGKAYARALLAALEKL